MNLKRKTEKKKVSIIGFWFGFDGSERMCVCVCVCGKDWYIYFLCFLTTKV
jgi:hypothetical protein